MFLDPAIEEHLLAVELPKSVILETETAYAMASLLAPPKPWAMKIAIDLKIWRDTCRPRFVAVGFRRDASVDSRLTYKYCTVMYRFIKAFRCTKGLRHAAG